MTYEIIKKNFDRKLWTAKMIRVAVEKSIITKDQFEEITNEKY
jgi:hypothetical protein